MNISHKKITNIFCHIKSSEIVWLPQKDNKFLKSKQIRTKSQTRMAGNHLNLLNFIFTPRTPPHTQNPTMVNSTLIGSEWSCSVMSNSLQPHGPYSQWNSPGQNTGMCSLSLLQGIFTTQVSNPGLPHCRRILYQLNHKKVKSYFILNNVDVHQQQCHLI